MTWYNDKKRMEAVIMDGKRIQEYWANEARSLLTIYQQFQTLLPDPKQDAAVHKGEDGRYIESLIKEYLRKILPRDLEVLTGFILRPAVKTGTYNRARAHDCDMESSQLDIIVYDSCHYPVFQRFGDNAIVPPEGVIAIISVKKKFNNGDFEKEAKALKKASKLCRYVDEKGVKIRGPYLAMVAMHSIEKTLVSTQQYVFEQIKSVYSNTDDTFDDAIGLVANLEKWSVFKRKPNEASSNAQYISMIHKKGEEHFGLQFLLTGILSVYYDPTRNSRERPGFTAFPSGRAHDTELGEIELCGMR